jgi:chorismate dehydratase
VEFDHPSALCKRLANGELDVALVSSFEFLRNPIYRIVDDLSISSDGPVYSVVVAHRGDISDIAEIELDPASETAVNLLRCLLVQLRLKPRLVQRRSGLSAVGGKSAPRAQLIIGDEAIRFRQTHTGEFEFWDLSEQWKNLVGLPFVYALWLIRPEIADADAIANRLRDLRDENLADLENLIAELLSVGIGFGQPKQFDYEFLMDYYRKHLRFSFGKREHEGLENFAGRCAKHGLIPKQCLELTLV